jgi:hypothetical protein
VYVLEPQVCGLDDDHVRERNDLYEQDGPMVWPMKDNERVHWVLALQPAQKVQPVVQQQSDHNDRGALGIQPLHLLYHQRPLWQQQRQQQPFFWNALPNQSNVPLILFSFYFLSFFILSFKEIYLQFNKNNKIVK